MTANNDNARRSWAGAALVPRGRRAPYAIAFALAALLLLVANTTGAGEFRWRHLLTLGVFILTAAAFLHALDSKDRHGPQIGLGSQGGLGFLAGPDTHEGPDSFAGPGSQGGPDSFAGPGSQEGPGSRAGTTSSARKRPSAPFALALGVFAAFVTFSAISLVWSVNLGSGLQAIMLDLTYLASFCLAWLALRDRGTMRVFMGGVTVVSVSLCAYGLGQYFFNFSQLSLFLSQHGLDYELSDRVFGRFTNPNTFAGFLAVAIPLTLALLLTERNRYIKPLWGLAMVPQLVCLYLTQSRGGWISAAVVLVLLLALLPRRAWKASWKILVVILLLAVALSFLSALYDPLGSGGESGGGGGGGDYSGASVEAAAGSMRGRLGIWRGGLGMFSHHLAGGVGAGLFGEYMQRYQYRAYYASHAHNYLLESGAETGIPGLLLMAALTLLVLLRIRKVSSLGKAGEARVYAVALWVVTVGFFLHNLADYTWYNPLTGAVFWLCAGGLFAVTEGGAGGAYEPGGSSPESEANARGAKTADEADPPGAGKESAPAADGPPASFGETDKQGGADTEAPVIENLRAPSGEGAVKGGRAFRPTLVLMATAVLLTAVLAVTAWFLVVSFIADTHEERGDEWSFLGEPRYALEEYERSLDFWEPDGSVHKKLGDTYRELFVAGAEPPPPAESAARSEEHYDRAIELDPGDAYKFQEKGVLLLFLGEHAEGRLYLEEAQRLYPNNPAPFLNEARSYLAEGREEEAEEAYLEAVALLPLYTDPNIIPFRESGLLDRIFDALSELAQLRVRRGDFRGALEAVDFALSELPGEARLYSLRAWVLLQAGEPERALEDCRRAAELEPEPTGIHLLMGEIYLEMGEYEEAKREFERELEINPMSEEAAEALRLLEEGGTGP